MTAPAHLSASASAAWTEIDRDVTGLEAAIVEMVAVQIGRMRDAASRVDKEGLLIADQKGAPIPHPALEVERAAQEQLRKLLGDLPAAPKKGKSGSLQSLLDV